MSRSTAEIVPEYRPLPGTDNVHGVTDDGRTVWVAAGDRLSAFDPARGKVLRSIAVVADAGTVFEGQHLFQRAADRIQKIDPKIGRVLVTIPAPGGRADSGLTWAEGTLWLGQYRKIYSSRSASRRSSSHDRVQPLRHQGHVGRRRAVARHLEWSLRNCHGDYGLLKIHVERA